MRRFQSTDDGLEKAPDAVEADGLGRDVYG
jgi:hypothetical protein